MQKVNLICQNILSLTLYGFRIDRIYLTTFCYLISRYFNIMLESLVRDKPKFCSRLYQFIDSERF